MSDIKIEWSLENAAGDWLFEAGDIAQDAALNSAIMVSLFTDRIATPDYKPTDGTTDRRGWWGDTYRDSPIGSRLWQLNRAKKVGQTPILLQAKDYCKEALEWLIEDGIATAIDVRTQWLSSNMLSIDITITKPDNTKSRPFRFSWTWPA